MIGDVLTLKDAAASLQQTPDTLRGAIKAGRLHATKYGRDWFVTSDEVERYRRENRRPRLDQDRADILAPR
jgi:excisionase family DNA binding protein